MRGDPSGFRREQMDSEGEGAHSANTVFIATYREIAEHFGLNGPEKGRQKAKRAGWPAEPQNHPADPVRVRVPQDEWDEAPRSRQRSARFRALAEERGGAFIEEGKTPPQTDGPPSLIKLLEEAVAALREERERLIRDRDTERMERTAAQAEASALRAERDAAQAEAATREDEVERLTLERDTERARVEDVSRQIGTERLRAAAAEAKEGELRAERERLLREWDMAQVGRKVAEDELTAWTTGGPLARAWRAFLNRRGRP
jgi:hypothetical protein